MNEKKRAYNRHYTAIRTFYPNRLIGYTNDWPPILLNNERYSAVIRPAARSGISPAKKMLSCSYLK